MLAFVSLYYCLRGLWLFLPFLRFSSCPIPSSYDCQKSTWVTFSCSFHFLICFLLEPCFPWPGDRNIRGSAPSKPDGDGNNCVQESGVQEAWRRDPQELVPRSKYLEGGADPGAETGAKSPSLSQARQLALEKRNKKKGHHTRHSFW